MKNQEKLKIENIGEGLKFESKDYYSSQKMVTKVTDSSIRVGSGWSAEYIPKATFLNRIRSSFYNIKFMPEILKPVQSIDAFSII